MVDDGVLRGLPVDVASGLKIHPAKLRVGDLLLRGLVRVVFLSIYVLACSIRARKAHPSALDRLGVLSIVLLIILLGEAILLVVIDLPHS